MRKRDIVRLKFTYFVNTIVKVTLIGLTLLTLTIKNILN
jgi:hypothetical protein